MIAEVDGIGAHNPDVGMPGQLQGEAGVLDFEPDTEIGEAEGDGTDDEPEIEVRGIKELNGRFF